MHKETLRKVLRGEGDLSPFFIRRRCACVWMCGSGIGLFPGARRVCGIGISPRKCSLDNFLMINMLPLGNS